MGLDDEVADRGVFWGLVALLFWVPLPLASNRVWAIGILVLAVFVLTLATAWEWRHQANVAIQRLRSFALPLAALGLFVTLVWAQTWVLPLELLAWISPETWAVQQEVAEPRLSLDLVQTQLYAALSTTYMAVFVVVLLTVRTRERLQQLAWCLVWAGLVQAVLGVALFSANATYQIFYYQVFHNRVIGSFVYHNHFAGYMELCLSVGIGLMLARLGNERTQKGNWRHTFARALAFVLSEKMRLRLMLVVLVIALVLTRSRMGNTAFFASMLIVGLITLVLTRRSAPAMVTLIISLIVVDVVVVGSWVGLEKVVDRVQGTSFTGGLKDGAVGDAGGAEESVELRADAAKHGIDLVKAFPLFGTGGGTFYNAYLRYRTLRPGYFDHAHNDYVELAADFGLVGLGLLGVLVLSTAWVCLRTLAKRRSSLPRGMAFGVLMAVVALAIHSSVDFNLQLPANVVTLMVVLAMGWVAWALPSGRARSS